MEKILYDYLMIDVPFDEFCKNLTIDHQGVYRYEDMYYYILPIQTINKFYKEFRNGCEVEIKSHIPEVYHPYINYTKFYADCIYNSKEYEFISKMNIVDYKYKIGIYPKAPNIPKL